MKKNKRLDKATQMLKELSSYIDMDVYLKSTNLCVLLDKADAIVEAAQEIEEVPEDMRDLDCPNFDFSGTVYDVRDGSAKHKVVMEELQSEWSLHNKLHRKNVCSDVTGIRSSQISALVMYLIT